MGKSIKELSERLNNWDERMKGREEEVPPKERSLEMEPITYLATTEGDQISMRFSVPVKQIGLTPDQALHVARDLIQKVNIIKTGGCDSGNVDGKIKP